jgi:hypothetical protein
MSLISQLVMLLDNYVCSRTADISVFLGCRITEAQQLRVQLCWWCSLTPSLLQRCRRC